MFLFIIDKISGAHIIDYSYDNSAKSICGKIIDIEQSNVLAADNTFDVACKNCNYFFKIFRLINDPRKGSLCKKYKYLKYTDKYNAIYNKRWFKLLKIKQFIVDRK